MTTKNHAGATFETRTRDLRFTKPSVTEQGSEGSGEVDPSGGITVAALYIDPRGPYPKMAGVECWDAERDAANYDGPWPVVAHPPCGPWTAFRHLYQSGEHCLGPIAFGQVRRFGGILEQPARSLLFSAAGAPAEPLVYDAWGGWWVAVDQLHWGHVAHKRTWLYFVGIAPSALTAPPYPEREPTHDLMGGRGRNAKANRHGRREASKELRRRTPPAFAEWLIELARSVRRSGAT